MNTHLPHVGVGPEKCEENMPFNPHPLLLTSLLGCWISLVEAIERIETRSVLDGVPAFPPGGAGFRVHGFMSCMIGSKKDLAKRTGQGHQA